MTGEFEEDELLDVLDDFNELLDVLDDFNMDDYDDGEEFEGIETPDICDVCN